VAITAVVVALTACAFAAAGDHQTLASIQRLDDAWLRLMISGQAPPLTAIAGHAVAASATVVAAVIALVPRGRRRAWWALAAVAFSILMGLSRAYLGAHWLSDAVAGILLGISCAVVTAVTVGQIQRRVEGRRGAA